MTQLQTEHGIVRVPAGTWDVDPSHSSVAFEVKHMMIATVRGHFSEFAGRLIAAEDDPANSRAYGTVMTASVDTGNADRDAHLRGPDFFDAERYPEIAFSADKLTLADGGTVAGSGELTIKGVTKPVELKGQLAAAPSVDPFGRERLGLSLETAIDRNEFGVAWNAPNQSGGNYLGDEVTLKADLTFVRQAD